MRVIVVGAGEVGLYIASKLSDDKHDVILIEKDEVLVENLKDFYNFPIILGDACSAHTLMQAEVDSYDYMLAMTSDDRVNILTCSIAKSLGISNAIARVHDHTYFDHSVFNYQVHFSIDSLINPEALCAVEIAKFIRHPTRVAVENFAKGQLEAHHISLSPNSKFLNKTLGDIRLDPNVRVIYIQRGDFFEVPTKDTILKENDLISLVGDPETLTNIRIQCNPEFRLNNVSLILCCATETATALIRLLTNPRFKIRLIESDVLKCRQLAKLFPHITVINGSSSSKKLLQEEKIDEADILVACSKSDEENIMIALQAKQLNAKQIYTITNKNDNEQVIDEMKKSLGVDISVSPRTATYNEIKRYITDSNCTELATISDNVGKILQIRINPSNRCVGKLIREIPWPKGCVVIALLRKYHTKVPHADDKILSGDNIVISVMKDKVQDLLKIF